MPILIGPVCAWALRRRTAGEARVAAPARPTLSMARRDGRNIPDICFPPMARRFATCRPFLVLPARPCDQAETLFRSLGLRGRCLHDPGLEVRGRHDLEHLEILGASDLAMRDAGNLVDAIALADRL